MQNGCMTVTLIMLFMGCCRMNGEEIMTDVNQEFVRAIYETVIREGIDEYKEMYETVEVDSNMDAFWNLYQNSNPDEKEILLKMMEQIMIDTVSHMLGIIDGSSTLNDSELEPKLLLDSQDTENELQDSFLELVELNLDGNDEENRR
ncbi:transposase [Exiguobacterium sp. s160]|uniref:transposase n=2 Tax=unclassified Exiguobacterium TaxID=2644629 RepID=UPI0020369214|nr:transposase [Exiguobacterium sp. s160]